ncbi:SDR family NAD(P)-dependent oxidoreductase [Streptomyces sp. NPDC059479]|uniref:SDR family NAD(P)-dependent oxidoreductase n=1 Tax=Streptomyces sp. NPDC059479 TaxID=3346848 RepID=UPI0036B17BD3
MNRRFGPTALTTPFTRESTADEVLTGVDLTGKRAVVTGAASGIGIETARSLARAGAEVTLAVRDIGAGRKVADGISAEIGVGTATGTRAGTRVHVASLELTDRASVEAFAAQWSGPLHILVNNAGIMALPELRRTREGFEQQFATNHLGHFRLALGLHQALARAGGARIVAVSSNAHLRSGIVFDDIHFQHRAYDPWLAYGQSKTANVLFAVEASKRWAADGITANAIMPGGIRTALQRHQQGEAMTPEIRTIFENYPWRTPEQGAATSVLVAASPLVEGVGGRYFENCAEALPHNPQSTDSTEPSGVAAHALDEQDAARLWEVSLTMLEA